jgi:hypothetical protein
VIHHIATVATVAALTLTTLTGCPAEPASSGASGTVVDRETRSYRNRPGRYYEITVKETSGNRDTGRVSHAVYESCQVGDAWPACKKTAK